MEHVPESHILEEYGDFAEHYEETLKAYGYVSDRLAPQMIDDALTARRRDASTEMRAEPADLAECGAEAPGRPWRVLDLGCGTGNTAGVYFARAEFYSVVGMDLTPEMVEKAKERPYEQVICQNIESELGVEDESFDAVQFIGVTEFLNKPRETFAEARRKLKEDGLLLITSPEKILRKMELKYKIKTWARGELEEHVSANGFKLLRTERFPAYDLGDVAVHYQCTLWQKTGSEPVRAPLA